MQYKSSSLLLTLAATPSDHHSLVTEQEHLKKRCIIWRERWAFAKMSPLSIEMLAIKEKIHLKRTIVLE
jgi:hypothetical protein